MELDDSTKQHRVAVLRVTKQRSAIKAITWRIIGTADTFAISLLITKEPVTAGAIASFEVLTKTILYYFHERGWNKIQWGRKDSE